MVERPIKKSERQTAAVPNDEVKTPVETVSIANEDTASVDQTSNEPKGTKPLLALDKTKVNAQKQQQKEQFSSTERVNPALMRGPKPTKPKPPVIKSNKEETDSNTTTEGSNTNTEGQ